MKILRLDLLAFGPFTGVSLSPNEGNHGLHLVYGPNEAGKSSSLRALRQLLFGIPHNSADNFIHANSNLRIGGLLEDTDGTKIELIRRKGRSKTVRGPDDATVLDENILTDILGGVDETIFNQRFGIDYEELRRGGQAVVRGGGDLGEILFAAGAGVADLGRIQQQLDDEASELFKPRGSLQKINKAVSDLTISRRAVKDSQLHTSKWKQKDAAMKEATKRKDEIESQLQEKRAEQNRMKRFLKAIPLIGQRKQLLDELSELEGVPLLPDDFASRRSAFCAKLQAEKQIERETTQVIKKLETQIDELDFQVDLLQHRTAISQLHTDWGSYQKAKRDRPKLVGQLEQSEQKIETIMKELGRESVQLSADDVWITRTQRQQIQALAAQRQARMERKEAAEKNISNLKAQIRQLESETTENPSFENIEELKRMIRTIRRQGEIEQLLTEKRLELTELEQQTTVDLQKLRLWEGSLDEIEILAIPSIETIDRFENDIADALVDERRIKERISTLREDVQQIEQALEKLQLLHDVPSADDLEQARRVRDEIWQLISGIGQGTESENEPDVAELLRQFPDADNLKQAFRISIDQADSIADRLWRDAEHVAEKTKLISDRVKKTGQLEELEAELDSAGQRLKQLDAQWLELWSELNITPDSPREMRSWFSQQQNLVEAARMIRRQRLSVEELSETVRNFRSELNSLLSNLNGNHGLEDETLAAMLDRSEQLVDEVESANQEYHNHQKLLQKLRDDLLAATQEATEAAGDLERWQNEWETAVSVLGLNREAQPSEANLVIEIIDDLTHEFKEAATLRERIQGIDEDNANFDRTVSELLGKIAPDLSERPLDLAVADLYDRLEAASTANTNYLSWKEQLETERDRRSEAVSNITELNGTIQAMCQQAGCETMEKLPEVERQSLQRRRIEEEIRTVNQRLGDLTASSSLNEFALEVEQLDTDQIQANVYRLEDELLQLDRERGELAESIGSLRNELQQMDGSGQAARQQEEAELLIAGIRNDASRYVRLRLASILLRRSIEQVREASQGPVIDRASQLFAELTLGSFDGLRPDYDEKGQAVLVGIRAQNRQIVHVENMSDGTCDQMYLAIRLAMLESTLQKSKPLPFIVDDILIMFDDARAVAALKVLASLSEKTQVIFFTHHEHLLELARESIDKEVLFTHTLS